MAVLFLKTDFPNFKWESSDPHEIILDRRDFRDKFKGEDKNDDRFKCLHQRWIEFQDILLKKEAGTHGFIILGSIQLHPRRGIMSSTQTYKDSMDLPHEHQSYFIRLIGHPMASLDQPFIIKYLKDLYPDLAFSLKLVVASPPSTILTYAPKSSEIIPDEDGELHAKLVFEKEEKSEVSLSRTACLSVNLHLRQTSSFVDDVGVKSGSLDQSSAPEDLKGITKNILEMGWNADAVIVAKNGKEFKCHECFLFEQLPLLKFTALGSNYVARVETTLSEDGVKAFLQYLYCLDLTDASNNTGLALELLRASTQYTMSSLTSKMITLLMEADPSSFTAETALEIFLTSGTTPEFRDLKYKMARVMRMKIDELEKLPKYEELFEKNGAVLKELMGCIARLGNK